MLILCCCPLLFVDIFRALLFGNNLRSFFKTEMEKRERDVLEIGRKHPNLFEENLAFSISQESHLRARYEIARCRRKTRKRSARLHFYDPAFR